MKKSTKINIIVYAAVIVLSVIFILVGYNICKIDLKSDTGEEFYTAKVTSVGDMTIDELTLDEGATVLEAKTIPFIAKITSGKYKGQSMISSQYIDPMYHTQPKPVTEGRNIIIAHLPETDADQATWQFAEYNRSNYLIILCILFFLIIIIIGRGKGIATILSLIFTAGVIFAVYIPSILKGYNIYASTIIISIYIILMSLIIINGVNKKTLSAILGNVGGVAVAAILSLIANQLLNITGIGKDEYVYLTFLETVAPIDLRGIVWGGVVIGSLGAIMDVSMSIASAMNEFAETMGNKSFKAMLKSGMNVGKDAIGTMTNTLILAYIGSSLATVLLLVANNRNLLFLFNLEMIVTEVLQAVIGSMGILFAVPVTTIFAAWLFNKNHTPKEDGIKLKHKEKVALPDGIDQLSVLNHKDQQ